MLFLTLAFVTALLGVVPLLFSRNGRKAAPWFGVGTLIVAWAGYYLGVPSLVWPLWGGVGVGVLAAWIGAAITTSNMGDRYYKSTTNRTALFPALLALFFMIRGFSGCGAFRASEYAALLGKVDQRTWTDDVQPTSPEHVRLVPEELALYLAKKQLGEASGAIGSQFDIADQYATLQRINGELWYIFPLDFKDFGVWTSSDAAPGYVKVHGEDPLRQPIVKTDEKFVYTPGAFFGENLDRHLWSNGYASKGLTDYSLEVDEEGKAWWVVTVFKPTIAWFGSVVEGVLIVDPATGDSSFHLQAAAPAWVDRIVPQAFIKDYIAFRGEYASGWVNSWWGEQNLTKPDHPDIVYGSDGEPYWVTGITSANKSDDSLLGIMYTSTRTGKTISYEAVGGTDAAALEAVNNKVSFKKWHGGALVPYNIYGTLAAVVPLLGQNHTFQGVGIVNIQTMQVALGDDAASAFREYQKLLAGAGGKLAPDIAHQQRELAGIVRRFASHLDGDGTVYYVVIGGTQHLFTGSGELSPKLPVTRAGDFVTMKYIESEELVVPLMAFDNSSVFEKPTAAIPTEPAPKPIQ